MSVASHQYTQTLFRQQLQQVDSWYVGIGPSLTKFTIHDKYELQPHKRTARPSLGQQKLNAIQKLQKGAQLLVEKVCDSYQKR